MHKRNLRWFCYLCCTQTQGTRMLMLLDCAFVCLPSTERKVKGDFPKDLLFIFVKLLVKSKLGLKGMLLDGILIGLV